MVQQDRSGKVVVVLFGSARETKVYNYTTTCTPAAVCTGKDDRLEACLILWRGWSMSAELASFRGPS